MDALPSLVLLLIAFPIFGLAIVKIGSMMLEHEIETVPGILSIGICLMLLVVIAINRHPWIPAATLLAFSTMAAFFPFARRQLQLQDHRNINQDAIEAAYASWAARPDNVAAALSLARSLHDRGFRGPAIGIASSVLGRYSSEFDLNTMKVPRDAFRNEDFLLRRWMKDFDVTTAAPIRCPRCHAPNDASRLECAHCCAPHVLDLVRSSRAGIGFLGKLVLSWALVTAVIVATVSSAALPAPYSAITIFLGFAIVFGVIGLLFKRARNDNTVYSPIVED